MTNLTLQRLVVGVAFLAASATPLFAQATTTTTSTSQDFHFVIGGGGCFDETIDVTGQIHVLTRSTVNPSGFTSREFHINLEGHGVGQISGASYQFHQVTHQVLNRSEEAPTLELSWVDMVRIISNGAAPNMRLRMTFNTKINANGESTVTISNFERVCE